jgi:hypothetical protein
MDDYTKAYSAEGLERVECWDCLENLDSQALMDVLHEPFNGIIHSCKCGKEYEVNVGFKITPILP